MIGFAHDYPFDPTCGMTLDDLLAVEPPLPPDDFASFWRARRARAIGLAPMPRLDHRRLVGDLEIFDLAYRSTDDVVIRGWFVRPKSGPVSRGLVVGHGYGGRDGPDLDMAFPETALLFPCLRGLGRSARPDMSSDPNWHVLHDIQDRDAYVLGGCVDDAWLAVSALLALEPQIAGHVGWSGISFGGGIGALMLPWEDRIARAELRLPTFGHHSLRRTLRMTGSGSAINAFALHHPEIMETLAYYDAASAARVIEVPVLSGLALFDPAVPPPGQFAIHNALPGKRDLVTFAAGHFAYPDEEQQDRERLSRARDFFGMP